VPGTYSVLNMESCQFIDCRGVQITSLQHMLEFLLLFHPFLCFFVLSGRATFHSCYKSSVGLFIGASHLILCIFFLFLLIRAR
jgi:hypothetical protein